MRLDKHHAFGNDFLITWDLDSDDDSVPAIARAVCDRRRGVGADGLLVGQLCDSDLEGGEDATMTLFNADGGRAEMSGNGVRCFAHALVRLRSTTLPVTLRVGTDAGVRLVEVVASDEAHTVLATATMGEVVELAPPAGWAELGVAAGRPVAHLGVGNPHTVVAVDDVGTIDLAGLGAAVPTVNLEVVAAGPADDAITMRVHERGVGLTEACGTGACAAAVAAVRWGLATPSDGKLVVLMDGGRASVALDGGGVSLSGPTTYIATIELP